MFEYSAVTSEVLIGGIVTGIVLSFIITSISVLKTNKDAEEKLSFGYAVRLYLLLAFSIFSISGFILMKALTPITDNPNIDKAYFSIQINEEKMSERIQQEANLNSVELSTETGLFDKTNTTQKLKSGKHLDFIAEKDGNTVKGYVFFKESTMNIVIDDKSDNQETIVVPVD